MTLSETLVQALFEHRGISENGQEYLREFVEADVRVMVITTYKWLLANEPQTDTIDLEDEDDLGWEWANGFESGTDAVITLLRKNLTPPHGNGKVDS